MKKLKKFLDSALSGNKLNLTLVEIRDLERIYNDLTYSNKSETIMQKSAELVRNFGINIYTKNIGWIITK